MNTERIVKNLTEQRDRVVAAIEALTGSTHRGSSAPRRRGKMSAAARRLSPAAKARWANAKKAGKNAL